MSRYKNLKPEYYFREMEVASNMYHLQLLVGNIPPHVQLQMHKEVSVHEAFTRSFDKAFNKCNTRTSS